MKLKSTLSLILVSAFPAGVIAVGCSSSSSPETASKGQLISCTTDPGTGVILRCDPSGGSDDGSNANTCQDIDEDGDGEPHDVGDDNPHQSANGADDGSNHDGSDDHGGSGGSGGSDDGSNHDGSDDHGGSGSSGKGTPGDRDGDGIPDDRDCDDRPGEDAQRSALPYDVRPAMGATTTPIADAFTARGGQAPSVVSVSMDGGTWRLAELQAGTSFVVTQDDCNHAGNRATGRDRVFVTWKNADGTTSTDHLDIRYCK